MTVGLLTRLTLLAAEATASGSFFDQMAARFRAGKGGMYPIAVCAVIALAIIIERIMVLFFSAPINKDGFLRGLKKHIYAGDLDKAINYVAGQKPHPAHQRGEGRPDERAEGRGRGAGRARRGRLRETPKLEARTGYLAMLGNAAMLAGLLGTVNGLIQCFEAVAHVNPADKATILSDGISEAMNCTFFGLLTAIPALITFSVLMGRTQRLINDINETSVVGAEPRRHNKDKFKNLTVARRPRRGLRCLGARWNRCHQRAYRL